MEKLLLTREHLLLKILEWYADGKNWAPVSQAAPYSTSMESAAGRDKGGAARAALKNNDVGSMLKGACDAYGLHLMELSRRADLAPPRIGAIVRGAVMTDDESERVRAVLDAMIAEGRGV